MEKMFLHINYGVGTLIFDYNKLKNKKLLLTIAFDGTIALNMNAPTLSIPNGNFKGWTTLTTNSRQGNGGWAASGTGVVGTQGSIMELIII